MNNQLKEFAFKRFGILDLSVSENHPADRETLMTFIRILFLKAGTHITIDFKDYSLKQDALFFVNPGQWIQLEEGLQTGTVLYYNRDFYCVEIHDQEVSCDGILFRNVYEIPVVYLTQEQSASIHDILNEITAELQNEESNMEEMLRILLKQIIIKSTRIWKQEHELVNEESHQEVDFIRKFSQLVESNYTRLHAVADYAELLQMTPKNLNKRITKYSDVSPNDLIKNRILLEAKRLLAHTDLSVKEIGYKLGYDDPAYFVRFFTQQTEFSPQHFRKQYQQSEPFA
ncbi:helix-turn-helix domain-containing protein [Xanthocytophaga agilis]|uniref:Helix-turn-helix domain-containing protein n=1 Tax=Xanthocytophaga agilis TaxID=3048010 RepID=A0AAE3R741_9BACT|nr:helix-turn-helix domain-containing protein [Xanthocytophaga agilis]MDJ1502674.1 helix-turn-helix domain-containing protein [Xanthocytophaga agilis]